MPRRASPVRYSGLRMARIGPRPYPLPLHTGLASILLRAPLFVAGTILFGTASLVASVFEKDGKRQHRIAQTWAKASLFFSGASLEVVGAERLHRSSAAVYACNHLSYMDTPAIFAALPFQFRIVARHQLWSIPFIGWHLRRSGQIPVSVDNPRSSIASLSGGIRTLRAGIPLFIFPEGGRTPTGEPTAFLNGPAYMAIRAQVALVPLALIGTHELLPMHSKTYAPGPVVLAVGEPIETIGLTPKAVESVTAELSRRISALFFEHSWRKPAMTQAVMTPPAS